jgi:hypothetical protein
MTRWDMSGLVLRKDASPERAISWIAGRTIKITALILIAALVLGFLFIGVTLIPNQTVLIVVCLTIVGGSVCFLWWRRDTAPATGNRSGQIITRTAIVSILVIAIVLYAQRAEFSTAIGILTGGMLAVPSIMRPPTLNKWDFRYGILQTALAWTIVLLALVALFPSCLPINELLKKTLITEKGTFTGIAVAALTVAITETAWLLTTWQPSSGWAPRLIPTQVPLRVCNHTRYGPDMTARVSGIRVSPEALYCNLSVRRNSGAPVSGAELGTVSMRLRIGPDDSIEARFLPLFPETSETDLLGEFLVAFPFQSQLNRSGLTNEDLLIVWSLPGCGSSQIRIRQADLAVAVGKAIAE